MKKFTLSLLVLGLVAAFVAPSGLAMAKGKKAAGPLVVGTDPAGDWGANVDAGIAPVGDALGQDLVGAEIGMADASTVNFVIKVNSLPPSGGTPEISRYNWDFTVNSEAFQLTGGFTEYLRGICNPTTPGTCPPPRDPGASPFFLRQGACLVGANIDCTEVALLHATFDAAAGTVTIPVPLATIKAKAGSKIGPGASSLGMSIYSATAAFVTNASLPNDQLLVTGIYTVPKGK
ncbi:MAG: hypothetical protein QOG04_1678 [Actinomycetota bacterium]|jgi:hypothetical protein|nr:hypothetical protein [Actinomycetota bacterium]